MINSLILLLPHDISAGFLLMNILRTLTTVPTSQHDFEQIFGDDAAAMLESTQCLMRDSNNADLTRDIVG